MLSGCAAWQSAGRLHAGADSVVGGHGEVKRRISRFLTEEGTQMRGAVDARLQPVAPVSPQQRTVGGDHSRACRAGKVGYVLPPPLVRRSVLTLHIHPGTRSQKGSSQATYLAPLPAGYLMHACHVSWPLVWGRQGGLSMCGSSEGMMYAATPAPPFATAIFSRSAASLGSPAAPPLVAEPIVTQRAPLPVAGLSDLVRRQHASDSQ